MRSTRLIEPSYPPKDPLIAAGLSFLLGGGIGQVYLGQVVKGVLISVVGLLAFRLFGLGLLVALAGAYDAYHLAQKLKAGQPIGDREFFWESLK